MSPDRQHVLDATVAKLLLASAIIALGTSGLVIAIPYYVLDKLGRADAVGTVVAASTIGYIASCLISQHLARWISPRILVTAAIVGVAAFIFLFQFTATVSVMFATMLVHGLCLGLVWAPLMGWLSGNAEGVVLSKRLGLFNIAWSTSIIIGPFAASYMVKHSFQLPFNVMAVVLVAAGLIVLAARYRPSAPAMPKRPLGDTAAAAGAASARAPESVAPGSVEHALMSPFKMQYIRYLGWAGAFVGYTAIGLFRYQMPHLARTIHMDEVVYGRVATTLSLAITLAFFTTARWSGWHGKTRWIFIPQVVLIAVAVLMTWTTGAWAMAALMLAGGFSTGMLYTNSVFYGSLGAAPSARTRRMAIHEIWLNVGVITGSYFGNLLSEHLGPRRVYPCLAAAIAAIALFEAAGWNLLMRRHRCKSGSAGKTAAGRSEMAVLR
jgi:MFS family permease